MSCPDCAATLERAREAEEHAAVRILDALGELGWGAGELPPIYYTVDLSKVTDSASLPEVKPLVLNLDQVSGIFEAIYQRYKKKGDWSSLERARQDAREASARADAAEEKERAAVEREEIASAKLRRAERALRDCGGLDAGQARPSCGHEKLRDDCIPCLIENVRRCSYWEGEAKNERDAERKRAEQEHNRADVLEAQRDAAESRAEEAERRERYLHEQLDDAEIRAGRRATDLMTERKRANRLAEALRIAWELYQESGVMREPDGRTGNSILDHLGGHLDEWATTLTDTPEPKREIPSAHDCAGCIHYPPERPKIGEVIMIDTTKGKALLCRKDGPCVPTPRPAPGQAGTVTLVVGAGVDIPEPEGGE